MQKSKSESSKLDLTAAEFERPSRKLIAAQLKRFREHAEAYGVPLLMLDSLMSDDVKAPVVSIKSNSEDDWIRPSEMSNDERTRIRHDWLASLCKRYRETTGRSCASIDLALKQIREREQGRAQSRSYTSRYEVPCRRAIGSRDYAIVRLTLSKGDESDWHRHFGDELIHMIHGDVHVELKDMGITIPLREGEILQFHAESLHGLRCMSDTAQALIVRFLQLDQDGPRYAFYKGLPAKHTNLSQELYGRIRSELHRSLLPFDLNAKNTPAQVESTVVDRHEFARFLEAATSVFPQHARKKRLFSPNELHRLKTGKMPIPIVKILECAKHFELQPFLLYDFLVRTYQPIVVIHAPQMSDDWAPIPAQFQSSRDVLYHVPMRRLAHSGISIAYLEFKGKSKTRFNVHPGHELIVPLEGTLSVRLKGERATDVSAGVHMYAEYDSQHEHFVANKSDGIGRCLVFRFYPSVQYKP